MPKAKAAPKKKAGGYVLAEKFTPGFQFKDVKKTSWTLGEPIGQGGFGLIYLAEQGDKSRVTKETASYVVKIEPKDNGPLFCEAHFYGNCAKEEDLSNFMKSYRLKTLAVPRYVSAGVCVYNEKEFRYLIMDRYVKDLQTVLNAANHCLPEHSVLYMTRQILYALEYIHSKGYAHGDIKGANLMIKSDTEVYLVDYGLATRFSREGVHQKYTEKPERRHNGTIEYTSRDAHNGVIPSRRADLEILGYCVVHWLAGTLPWMGVLKNNEEVQRLKISSMKNVKDFLKNVFQNSTNDVSDPVIAFLDYFLSLVGKLEFNDEPNYFQIQTKLSQTIKACGYANDEDFGLLSVASTKATNGKRKQKEATTTTPSSGTKGKAKATTAAAAVHVNETHESDDREDDSEIKDSTSKRVKKNLFHENSPLNAAKSILRKHEQSSRESPKVRTTPVKPKETPTNGHKNIFYETDDDEIEEIPIEVLKKPTSRNGTPRSTSKVNGKAEAASPCVVSLPQVSVDDKAPTRQRKYPNYKEDIENDDDDGDYEAAIKARTPTRITPSRRVRQQSTESNSKSSVYSVDEYNKPKPQIIVNGTHNDDNEANPAAAGGRYTLRVRRHIQKSTSSTQTDHSALKK